MVHLMSELWQTGSLIVREKLIIILWLKSRIAQEMFVKSSKPDDRAVSLIVDHGLTILA